jgi:hypothetical protein
MPKIEIDITEEEKLTLEFRNFEYCGLQIGLNQFLSSDYEYNEEHYNRLVQTLIEKYTLLQKCLMDILTTHGHRNIAVRTFDLHVVEDKLVLYW